MPRYGASNSVELSRDSIADPILETFIGGIGLHARTGVVWSDQSEAAEKARCGETCLVVVEEGLSPLSVGLLLFRGLVVRDLRAEPGFPTR